MSIETLLVLAAASLFVLLLPSPCGRMLRDYGLARGRLRASLLLPALWFAYLLAGAVAGAAYLLIHAALPSMNGPLSWAGLGVMMFFIIRSQHQRVSNRLADNDNLPAKNLPRSLLLLLFETPRPLLILALLSLLLQLADSPAWRLEGIASAGLAYAAAVFFAPIIQLFIAAPAARKIRRTRQKMTALRKPRTRFIASRAVTAGYRRIAA